MTNGPKIISKTALERPGGDILGRVLIHVHHSSKAVSRHGCGGMPIEWRRLILPDRPCRIIDNTTANLGWEGTIRIRMNHWRRTSAPHSASRAKNPPKTIMAWHPPITAGRRIKDGHAPLAASKPSGRFAALNVISGVALRQDVQGTLYLLTKAPKRISKRIS
jgi:hypothetical protein